MRVEQQLPVLEQMLNRLVREWERFFAGDRRTPPVAERTTLERRLRALLDQPSPRRAEQFRVEQLQHRFMSYFQMWERMLREREEGRSAFPIRRPSAAPPPPDPASAAASSAAPPQDSAEEITRPAAAGEATTGHRTAGPDEPTAPVPKLEPQQPGQTPARQVPPRQAVPQQPAAAAAQRTAPNAGGAGSVSSDSGSLFDRYVAAKRRVGQEAKVDQRTFLAQLEGQKAKIEAKLGQKVRFDVVVEGDKVKLAARKIAEK